MVDDKKPSVVNTDNVKDKDEETMVEGLSKDDTKWGELPENHFGYASDEERREKRGLEDWELVDSIPESQERVPPWFFAVIVAVLLVAIGLSFPFWGERPGYEKEAWLDWGFGVAILYLVVFGTFVYFMVNFYGSKHAGRLDSDKENIETHPKTLAQNSGSQNSGSLNSGKSKENADKKS